MNVINSILQGDWITQIRSLPDKSVNCCITSPPYYGLRDYGVDGQIGLEESPELFVNKLVEGFNEVHRVLADDGTVWINIGDSYAASNYMPHIKRKELVGIPWTVALAMRNAGWYLRQDIIWSKPNPMPESVQDRCTRSHEYIFMFSKFSSYYYDAYAIRTPYADKTLTTWGSQIKGYGDGSGLVLSENWASRMKGARMPKQWKSPTGWDPGPGAHNKLKGRYDRKRGHNNRHKGFNEDWDRMSVEQQRKMGANKRSVWTVAPKGIAGEHFATFPQELVSDMIKAGCPPGGLVLDPFFGSGTTGIVARKLGRNYIGIELNPSYIEIAETRLREELGMFK